MKKALCIKQSFRFAKWLLVCNVLISSLFASCKPKNEPTHEDLGPIDQAEMFVRVLKFNNTKDADYVPMLACSSADGILYYSLPYLDVYVEALSDVMGKTPYIALPNDYLVYDWKINTYFMPEFLTPIHWEEITDYDQRWNCESLESERGLPRKMYDATETNLRVKRSWIDAFLGIAPKQEFVHQHGMDISTDYARPYWLGRFETAEEIEKNANMTLQSCEEEIARQDSLQNVYIKRLTSIIEEGRLQDLLDFMGSNFYKNGKSSY